MWGLGGIHDVLHLYIYILIYVRLVESHINESSVHFRYVHLIFVFEDTLCLGGTHLHAIYIPCHACQCTQLIHMWQVTHWYVLLVRECVCVSTCTMSRMSMHTTDSYVTGNSLICSSCSWVCVRVNLYHVTHVNALTTDSSQICDIQLINMWQVTHWYVLLVRECVCACQLVLTTHNRQLTDMWWLRIVGSIKSQVSFAEYCLFYRALLQKRHII